MNLALIAGMLLACGGMLGLCLGLERYYKQLRQPTPAPVVLRTLRCTGWIALLASLACCIQAWDGPMGAVAWLGNLSLAALTVAFLVPYASRLRRVPEPERAEVRQTT